MFGCSEARAFQVVDDGHRLALEQLAGSLGDFQVLALELRMLRQERLAVALHERVVQPPPCEAQQRYPDQFLFQEELEERRAPVECLDQRGNIHPRLMIADDQIGGVTTQPLIATNVPLRRYAGGEDDLVDLGPGFGDPHHRR